MGFSDILKSLFGNKSTRDLKKIMPVVEKINAVYPEIEKLTNDELRSRIDAVRKRLQDSIADKKAEIANVKEEIERTDYDLREPLWARVDKMEQEILDILEKGLEESLPEVYAVVKDTARRFTQNEVVEVTATEFDRNLAAQGRDFVSIEGDKALYRNSWVAGGNKTVWDMIHYQCQLIGGIVLHQGKIAEMATGEGKTLVATLPVFLNALTGNGVHVVTVNDYLAKRDSEWMGPLYMFHGLSVACIDKTQPNSPERRAAYNADITFGTNNEFGFDYLRDNMATSPEDLVQRAHNFAIVDEVDSVLIDDARTPLIISGPVPKGDDQMYEQYQPIVERLYDRQRKLVTSLLADAKKLMLSDDKKQREEGALLVFRAFKGLPKYDPLIKFLSQEGIKPAMLEQEAYYMQDNSRQMHIVTDPLYFVIDEKNHSVELTDKGYEELASGNSDPKFFVLPDIASELSAVENEPLTDEEKAQKKDELMQNYAVKSERVHTVNQLIKAYALFTRDVDYVITDDNKVKIVDEQTGRIMEGRRWSDGLHQAVEAKEHVKVEAATQTFATITLQNYFRMYHKLSGMTGTAETEAGEFWDIYKLDVVTIPTNRPVARIDMDDRVYKTRKEKYNAVIDEIEKMHLMGRPTLVGTTSVEISELLYRMVKQRLKIEPQLLNAKPEKARAEADIVALAGQQKDGKGVVTIATNMAGRGTDIKLSPEVKAAGGLAIIGTERHESRRVDRQLRGRAGRQGDPGSSVFFVSFEDPVMRQFVSDKVVKMLDRLGLQEGEMIEAPMVTRSIENAQKRVEENHFGVRKHLLEYDDVMNVQRNVIYTRRHHALMGERVGLDIMEMLQSTVENVVERYSDYDELKMHVMTTFAIDMPFGAEEYGKLDTKECIDLLHEKVVEAFNHKQERLAQVSMPVISNIAAEHGREGLVRVPITDGRRIYGITCNLGEAIDSECKSISKSWEKMVLLMTIDEAWKVHLRELDQLRQSVQNASYEQKDPLVIYKTESFNLFGDMLAEMNTKAVSILMRGQIPNSENAQNNAQNNRVQQTREVPRESTRRQQYNESKEAYPGANTNREVGNAASQSQRRVTAPVVNNGPKIGRNDPCPCGSGKKYKNCHGRGL